MGRFPESITGPIPCKRFWIGFIEHASNDNWKQPGFRDETIEKWLDNTVAMVAKAAEFPELKLPVRLADVKPAAAPGRRVLESALFIGTEPHR